MEEQAETQTEVTTVQEVPAQSQVVKTTKQVAPQIRTEHPQVVYQKKKALFRTYQIIWLILGAIEVLLAFRIGLKMLGANPFAGFADLIYTVSAPFALPFQGILGTSVASQGSVFEWSTIIAMIVYAIIAGGIVQIMQLFKPTNPREVSEAVDNQPPVA